MIKAKHNRPLTIVSLLLLTLSCETEQSRKPEPSTSAPASPEMPLVKLTRREVFEARRNFTVEVVSFDASKGYGERDPVSGYTDYVRLRITNNSNVTLPYLTVKTIRANHFDEIVGWSRAPSIPVSQIRPGDTAEVDYYPKGHMDSFIASVDKIVVVIEPGKEIDAESAQFFKELENTL